MNIKDAYIHNGLGVLRELQVTAAGMLQLKRAAKDSNDAYVGWEDVYNLTNIKPTNAGTADNVPWTGITGKPDTFPVATHDHDDRYLKLAGNGTTNPMTGTIYIKDVDGLIINSTNKTLNIWEVYGNSGAWASQYGFNLQYYGAGSGNDNDLILWAHAQTAATHAEVFRVHQDGSFIFKTAPKVGTNAIYHAGNLTIKTLMGTTAIGDTDEPVYWSGTAFVKANAYPTKASWNYDDVYLKLSGGTLTGDLTLKVNSGDSPKLIFQRGTLTDSLDDWRIFDTGGNLKFQHTTGSTTDWKDYIIFSATAGTLTINGNTALHSGNYTSYTVKKDGTGATGTWSIDISGNAATATTATNSDKVDEHHAMSAGSLLYKYAVTATIPASSVSGDFWYATITFTRSYVRELTRSMLDANYSNHQGQVYLNTYEYNGAWYAFTTNYNGSNIKGIAHKSQNNPIYYIKLAKPVTYNNTTPDGTITVYSPYNCTIAVSATAPSGVTFTDLTTPGFTNLKASSASSADSATTATYASNVGAAGTAGTNYVTAAKVIATCNWYDTMTGSDTDTVINRWSEIVNFVANFEETPDLATYLSNNYLAKSGGTMTGQLKWNDSNALPEQTSPQYFLCIDAFNSGGTTKWASKANTLKALTGLTSTAIGDADEPVYWDGSKFVKAGAYPTKASWNYDDKYVKLSSTEQTIESTISSFSKGIVEFYRSSGDHIAFITFSNKANNAKRVLGSIGFYSGGVGKLQYRSADAKFYDIVNGSNITTYIVGTASTTLSTSEQTLLTIKSGESGSLSSTTVKVKLPATDPYTSARTPTAHTHYATTFKDSRNEAMTPTQGVTVNGVAIDFKTKANGVGAGSGAYCGLVTFDPYSDVSGGYPLQMGFNSGVDASNTNELYIRTAKTADTWNAWRTVITSSNITTYINDCRNNIVDLRANPQTFNPSYLKDIVFISEADYTTLVSNGSITKNSITHTYNASNWYVIEDKVPEYAENAGNADYASNAGRANSAESADKVEWSGIQNKPLTATRWPGWSEVTDKPTWVTWLETSSTATYSLSNATWTQTITLPTAAGSYILKLVSGNSTLTGVFSIGASDNAKDEISLHLHGNGPRLYARTNGTKLELSRNIATATNTSVTITYRRMI